MDAIGKAVSRMQMLDAVTYEDYRKAKELLTGREDCAG